MVRKISWLALQLFTKYISVLHQNVFFPDCCLLHLAPSAKHTCVGHANLTVYSITLLWKSCWTAWKNHQVHLHQYKCVVLIRFSHILPLWIPVYAQKKEFTCFIYICIYCLHIVEKQKKDFADDTPPLFILVEIHPLDKSCWALNLYWASLMCVYCCGCDKLPNLFWINVASLCHSGSGQWLMVTITEQPECLKTVLSLSPVCLTNYPEFNDALICSSFKVHLFCFPFLVWFLLTFLSNLLGSITFHLLHISISPGSYCIWIEALCKVINQSLETKKKTI